MPKIVVEFLMGKPDITEYLQPIAQQPNDNCDLQLVKQSRNSLFREASVDQWPQNTIYVWMPFVNVRDM